MQSPLKDISCSYIQILFFPGRVGIKQDPVNNGCIFGHTPSSFDSLRYQTYQMAGSYKDVFTHRNGPSYVYTLSPSVFGLYDGPFGAFLKFSEH